jgi:hypothetical protein
MGLSSVTALAAVFELSAVSVALTVIAALGGNSGAAYKPETLIVPSAALPPAMPFTDQATVGAAVAPASLALKD